MGEARVKDRVAAQEERDTYGVLVGWRPGSGGAELHLVLQSVASGEARERGEIDNHHLLLSRQQALQLAHYLSAVSGAEPPPERKRGLMRLLG